MLPSGSPYQGSHGRSLAPVEGKGADGTGHSDDAGFDANGAFLTGLPTLQRYAQIGDVLKRC